MLPAASGVSLGHWRGVVSRHSNDQRQCSSSCPGAICSAGQRDGSIIPVSE